MLNFQSFYCTKKFLFFSYYSNVIKYFHYTLLHCSFDTITDIEIYFFCPANRSIKGTFIRIAFFHHELCKDVFSLSLYLIAVDKVQILSHNSLFSYTPPIISSSSNASCRFFWNCRSSVCLLQNCHRFKPLLNRLAVVKSILE